MEKCRPQLQLVNETEATSGLVCPFVGRFALYQGDCTECVVSWYDQWILARFMFYFNQYEFQPNNYFVVRQEY